MITACISVIYLLIIVLILSNSVKGKDYHIVGSEPKALFVDGFFATASQQRLIRFYVNEIINYQTRIETNKTRNEARWKWFNICLMGVTITPILISATYSVIYLTHH